MIHASDIRIPCRVSLPVLNCVLLLVCLPGCGGADGDPCWATGSVTLNDERIEQGTIVFEPLGQGGARGGATINDGTYQIPEDRGMWAGSFTVRIIGYRQTGETEAPFEALDGESTEDVDKVEEIVPRKYNSNSTLEVTLTAGENQHDFELTGTRVDGADDGPVETGE